MGSKTMGGKKPRLEERKVKGESFQKARTVRRLARRRGWHISGSDEPTRNANGRFPMVLHFSCDKGGK